MAQSRGPKGPLVRGGLQRTETLEGGEAPRRLKAWPGGSRGQEDGDGLKECRTWPTGHERASQEPSGQEDTG